MRSASKAQQLKDAFPNIRTVEGTLESGSLLETESSKADIVLRACPPACIPQGLSPANGLVDFADCDHVPAAKSIVAGQSKASKPVFLIHTSGAAILPDISDASSFGKAPTASEHFSDVADVGRITSLPLAGHLHRDVDSVVLGAPSNVRTAIVCPPTIYGSGSSLQPRSNQVPELIKHTISSGRAFKVVAGESVWNNVHVDDLSALYLLLTEAAARGGDGADWDADGYYFSENGQHVWGELAKDIAARAKKLGLIAGNEVASLSPDDTKNHHPFGPVLWGTNSIGKADRARKLGWKPTGKSLVDTLDEAIQIEAKALKKL